LKGTLKDGNKTYHITLHIDADDRIVEATCEGNFMMNKLRKGLCEHILATRMAWNKQN
jgi:hypothetical protein